MGMSPSEAEDLSQEARGMLRKIGFFRMRNEALAIEHAGLIKMNRRVTIVKSAKKTRFNNQQTPKTIAQSVPAVETSNG